MDLSLSREAVSKGFGVFKYLWAFLLISLFCLPPAFAVDDIPPVISNLRVAATTDTTAVIEWTTDELSDSVVQYGIGGIYNYGESDGAMVTGHSITLIDLNPDTTYNYRVFSTDASLNTSTISGLTFTTDSVPDVTPPVVSNVHVSSKSHNAAVIAWTTDEGSDSVVQYDITTSTWGSYASSESNGSMVTNHSVNLTGLLPSTTYYFQVGSTDSSDNGPTTSDEVSFTTDPPPDTTPPVVSNVQVASKTHDSAVITWTTDEQSNSAVQYGTVSSGWGSYPSSQNDDSLVTDHSVTLTGLNGSTTYFFQAGSSDGSGNGPTVSSEMNFTTDEPPDVVPPFMVQFPTIDYANKTIDVTFSESNMQNATIEANYTFSPSLLFKTLGGSDDIANIGGDTYRLSMSSIPNHQILTLTVSNILDEAGNPVTPNSLQINDNDGDGMADDWETDTGIANPSEDTDGDGLDNFGEYSNGTNPNNPDTDGDGLPDGWELTYDLDPNDDTGVNGASGDPDGDSWTNYEEYLNGYFPNSDNSPKAKDPKIKKSIPRDKSGIHNHKRIPIDTSFAVRIQASDGIGLTDPTSIKFTINDGTNPIYERNVSDTAVVRVVKLKPDADTRATDFWIVYDRSLDAMGNFSFDTNVNIKVDVTDRRGTTIPQESYDFNIETTEEHDLALADRPEMTVSTDAGMTTLTVVNNTDLDGFQIIYDSTEPIIPHVEPLAEIPQVDLPDVTPVALPVELGPPNVFNNPVTLRMPVTGDVDVKDLSVYLFDGEEWVYAASSYNTGGVIQTGGDGWVVPGSLTYDDSGITPVLEIQVYHFSGIQAGLFTGLPSPSIDLESEGGGGGGGCFIDTLSNGSSVDSPFYANKMYGYLSLFIFLASIALALGAMKRRLRRDDHYA